MAEVLILDAVRTAIGKRNGSLSHSHANDVLGATQKGIIERTGIDPAVVDQVIGGCVQQVGMQSANVARKAWLAMGLPQQVAAATVNSQCGSSQEANKLSRNQRISSWAEATLAELRSPSHWPNGLEDLAFVVNGTAADLRFLDGNIDPSDREVGVTLRGPPTVANYMPAGITRVTTLRAWLNQWSMDHTNADSLRSFPEIDVPVLIELGTADPTVLPHMAQQMFDASTASPQRDMHYIAGATHYFENQPELLTEALDVMANWINTHVVAGS